jgi:hypothetical protein
LHGGVDCVSNAVVRSENHEDHDGVRRGGARRLPGDGCELAASAEAAVSNEAAAGRGATLHTGGEAILVLMDQPLTNARMTSEERVDAALEDSFPASDAPWWSLGVTSPPPEEAHGAEPVSVVGRS